MFPRCARPVVDVPVCAASDGRQQIQTLHNKLSQNTEREVRARYIKLKH